MTRIIAIANQKGGTGKTTTAINIAAGLARISNNGRVMLIDIDPQANATAVYLGVPFAAGPRQTDTNTIYEVLLQQTPINNALQTISISAGKGRQAELDILPAHLDLASAELELVNIFERERRLRQALIPIQHEYSFIIIDCPPSLGLLTVNALMVATEVIIPVDPGLFPIIGLNLLNNTISMVQRANPQLRIMGVLPTLSDRTALFHDTHNELDEAFGHLLLPTIPRRVAFGEAHAAGEDIFLYNGKSDGAKAYVELIKEILHRG